MFMIEPYVSLVWWAVGCLVVAVAFEVVAFRCASVGRRSWCGWLGWVHVPVWGLLVALFVVACRVGDLGADAFGLTAGVVGIVGCLCVLPVVAMSVTGELDFRVFRPISVVLLLVLPAGLVLNSFMAAGDGFRSTSVEYTVSADGSKSPVVAERHDLARVGSSGWVTVSAVEHKRPGRDSASEIRTAYTWSEVRGNETVAKTTTVEQDDVSVVEDVAAGGTPWVEYIPMYHLVPAGIFDGSHADPIQGKLCVRGRDTDCKVNALRANMKYVLHVPASA